jgi:hypothetical protein
MKAYGGVDIALPFLTLVLDGSKKEPTSCPDIWHQSIVTYKTIMFYFIFFHLQYVITINPIFSFVYLKHTMTKKFQ